MITTYTILSLIDEISIMERYLGIKVALKKQYKNPFREDKNPGCYFYYNKSNRLIFRDTSHIDLSGDCFMMCAIANKLDLNSSFLQEVIQIIDHDFNLCLMPKTFNDKYLPYSTQISQKFIVKKDKRTQLINECYNKFKPFHLDYWYKYNITTEILSKFNVRPIFRAFIGKIIWYGKFKKDPLFEYLISKKTKEIQIYRPYAYNKKDKFRTNAKNSPLMGLEQLPNHVNTLIITSSYKDVMVYDSLGLSAICPIGEQTLISDDKINMLQTIADNIIINYDNDKTGKIAAHKLHNRFPEFSIFITPIYKDISDYIYNEGKSNTMELINKHLLSNNINNG